MPSRHQELVQRTLGAYLTGDEETLRAMFDEFREGQVIRFHVYATVDDALDAARRLAER